MHPTPNIFNNTVAGHSYRISIDQCVEKSHSKAKNLSFFKRFWSVPLILIAEFCVCFLWSRVLEESLALLLFLMKSIVLIRPLVITSKLKAGHPVIWRKQAKKLIQYSARGKCLNLQLPSIDWPGGYFLKWYPRAEPDPLGSFQNSNLIWRSGMGWTGHSVGETGLGI